MDRGFKIAGVDHLYWDICFVKNSVDLPQRRRNRPAIDVCNDVRPILQDLIGPKRADPGSDEGPPKCNGIFILDLRAHSNIG